MGKSHSVSCRFTTLACVLVVAGAVGCGPHRATRGSPPPQTPRPGHISQPRPNADPLIRRQLVVGYSVERRPITVFEIGDPDSTRRALIVGCIHGNEPAGIAIARSLLVSPPPSEVDLWVLPDLNPDGVQEHRRGNARGVDLNRNFPDRWRPLGPVGTATYAGPRALSEPESRAVAALLGRIRPTVAIWYHQALDAVDSSQGPATIERRYSRDTWLPLRPLPD
jgi:protein MpaA